MNITGIIAEYNPLHNGHIYHIKKAREITKADGIVVVMSGNFVQRGLPAMIDKWNRAKMALENGADLVLELPVIYSLSSAEFFSFGAVSILDGIGVVNNLCFGSEAGDISTLDDVAQILQEEPPILKEILWKYLEQGMTYPLARSKALHEYIERHSIQQSQYDLQALLSTSNNILGIEYCKSIRKLQSTITPFTIQRKGGSYNSTELNKESYSSATSIRNFIAQERNVEDLKDQIPLSCYEHIRKLKKSKYPFPTEELIFPFIKYKGITYGKIDELPDVSEGLHNRIQKAFYEAQNYSHLVSLIKSKRYTQTRIHRILCQYFIGFDQYDSNIMRKEPSSYSKILGFTKLGTEILKRAKGQSKIPLFTKLPKDFNSSLALDLQSTKAYSLLNSSIRAEEDFLQSPILLGKEIN